MSMRETSRTETDLDYPDSLFQFRSQITNELQDTAPVRGSAMTGVITAEFPDPFSFTVSDRVATPDPGKTALLREQAFQQLSGIAECKQHFDVRTISTHPMLSPNIPAIDTNINCWNFR